MPRWILNCPECQEEFTHSEVRESLHGISWWDEKPELPESGIQLECPNCKKTSAYQRYQLIYRKDDARRKAR
jgi:endogenous inhibitor of DNA gyrase (YacG/DUF329 family)